MAKKGAGGHDRRLKWGDGWIDERTTAAGEARYLASWREDDGERGSRKRARSFRTRAAAEAFLRDLADRRAKAGYVAPERATVADLVAAFLDRGSYAWSPATRVAYRQRAANHVLPALGGLLAAELTPPRVQHWVDALVRQGLAASTIEGAIRVLAGAFKEAVRLGAVPSNPVAGTKRPTIRPRPVAVWTAAEAKRVLAAVAAEPLWRAAYALALATGVRPGELRVVRWSDLDLDRGLLVVRRSLTKDDDGRQVVGETTKGKRSRPIALPPSAVAALRGWRTAQLATRLAAPRWHDPDLVFADGAGRPLSQRRWYAKHAAVIAAAGVPPIVPHGIRHTNATLELAAGTHPKVVAERLGHTKVQFTLDRYSHVSVELQRRAAEALEGSLFGEPDATTRDDQIAKK